MSYYFTISKVSPHKNITRIGFYFSANFNKNSHHIHALPSIPGINQPSF
ncbi:MAG: hypothetical protein ABIN89_13035 [Chitinophagaceae bacterium]